LAGALRRFARKPPVLTNEDIEEAVSAAIADESAW